MSDGGSGARPDAYRTRYLELKSVVADPNTGLPAYVALLPRLRALLDERRRIGVLYVELGGSEVVESLYGWQVIDRMSAAVATAVREAVGAELPESTLLAIDRVAGDGVVAFLPEGGSGEEIDARALDDAADRLRERVRRATEGEAFAGLAVPFDVRVGRTFLAGNPYYRYERRVHAAIDRASSLEDRLAGRRERSFEEELRTLVRKAELTTLFHPVVELDSGEVIGFEALARGPRGTRLEYPGAMFAASRDRELLLALDRLCRNRALSFFARTKLRGLLFVNVLPESLRDPEWRGETVVALLGDAMRSPSDVVIEVSERSLDPLNGDLEDAIRPLREFGFRVSIDDVGSGRASLHTLQRLKPDFVKLDTQLVRSVDSDPLKQDALGSLVSIAARLGARAVAEGVENDDEANVLRRLGVPLAQGFHFARPAPGGPDG